MNLDNLNTLLCFAFQVSDGPYPITIIRINGSKEDRLITKEELFKLSEDPDISVIYLAEETKERRWRDR